MKTYKITEKQNLNSVRAGETIAFKSLRAAKIYASKNQVWCETVLTIEDEMGYLLSAKRDNQKWIDNI